MKPLSKSTTSSSFCDSYGYINIIFHHIGGFHLRNTKLLIFLYYESYFCTKPDKCWLLFRLRYKITLFVLLCMKLKDLSIKNFVVVSDQVGDRLVYILYSCREDTGAISQENALIPFPGSYNVIWRIAIIIHMLSDFRDIMSATSTIPYQQFFKMTPYLFIFG